MNMKPPSAPAVLVLASTYPRWEDDYEPGFIHELCRRLTDRFRVIAVVPDAPGADSNGYRDGVKVHRYRYAPRSLQTLVHGGGITNNLKKSPWKWILVPAFIIGQYLAARKICRDEKISIIHAHWLLPQGFIAMHLAAKYQIPFIVTSHGGDLFGLRGWLLNTFKRRVVAASAAMTVVSHAMKEESLHLGFTPKRLEVIPMGVDLENRFVPKLDAPRSSTELLFVGRLVPKKGLPHLLDALPSVLVEQPDTRLTIAGFGPEEKTLKARAKQLGIADQVNFLGALPQKELAVLYQRAALFVAPFVRAPDGDQEGLPVALMEAVGCACPAVVGRVPGLEDLLGNAAQDIMVDPTDTKSLAKAILTTLSKPEAACSLAERIRKSAVGLVGWSSVARAYGNLLDDYIRR